MNARGIRPAALNPPALLSRDEFRKQVFLRDGHRCVICGDPAQDAHHIMERRLWHDGGYYLENGASLCGEHHLQAEKTLLSCEEISQAAGITRVILPEHLYDDARYDKWGNVILPDGRRIRGELFDDESVQKILAAGGMLERFTRWVKYPRTHHLPWSPGRLTKDERTLRSTGAFLGRRVVVLTKMDGENFTLYRDYAHARAPEGQHRPWQDWVRNLQAQIGWEIPDGWRICGENLYARHTIAYQDLPSYYMAFAMYDQRNVCLSWGDTAAYAEMLGIPTPPVLYDGIWDEEAIQASFTGKTPYSDDSEGYVVRLYDEFPFSQFRFAVAKYVREGFRPVHGGLYQNGRILTNQLAADPSRLVMPRY